MAAALAALQHGRGAGSLSPRAPAHHPHHRDAPAGLSASQRARERAEAARRREERDRRDERTMGHHAKPRAPPPADAKSPPRALQAGDVAAQAREARLHVLDEMAARGVDEPQQLSDSVPKTKTLQVEPAKIGKIIGKGGETIRGLIADHCA